MENNERGGRVELLPRNIAGTEEKGKSKEGSQVVTTPEKWNQGGNTKKAKKRRTEGVASALQPSGGGGKTLAKVYRKATTRYILQDAGGQGSIRKRGGNNRGVILGGDGGKEKNC